jgi:hypothetical protein
MDNPTPVQDNVETPAVETPAVETPVAPAPVTPQVFNWKGKLGADLANAPTFQKFEDNELGLKKAFESHANLEKLLGHEKVPVPKDANDLEGWARYRKAFGVPDNAEGYGLADIKLAEGISFDKKEFSEIAHKQNLTPAQAQGLWKTYNEIRVAEHQKLVEAFQTKVSEVANTLRKEWGDAYAAKVELGQMVINKFSDDQEMVDFLTTSFAQDPRGIKFLAKIGSQFAENKIGSFHANRFAQSPQEAQAELEKIRANPNHPYLNPKATEKEHAEAVELVNRLETIVFKAKQGKA